LTFLKHPIAKGASDFEVANIHLHSNKYLLLIDRIFRKNIGKILDLFSTILTTYGLILQQ
jgi:hypothetical protein